MRRSFKILVCLGVLVFAGAGTALAGGPHHRPPAYRQGYRPPVARHVARRPPPRGYYAPAPPVCAVPRPVAAYPAYPVPAVAGIYPQFGFGVAGRNFSLFFQQ